MARREFVQWGANLFKKNINIDRAEPGFKPDHVAAEVKKDDKILLKPPVMIESKGQSEPGSHCESDNKFSALDVFLQNNPQRNVIREQKLTEMAMKKMQKTQTRKKNKKSEALDDDEFAEKLSALKIDLNSNIEYNRDRFDSGVNSCKSSSTSETTSEPATSPTYYSLFDEFTFIRRANVGSCQESYQYAGNPRDNFCSNSKNCSCFAMKKYDEDRAQFDQHDYAQAYGHNLQYELNQDQPTSKDYQLFSDYNNDSSPFTYSNGNSVFQFSQAPEEHQSPSSSFAPKLNEFPDLEKIFVSQASNDCDSEIHQSPTASFAPKLNEFSGWEKFFASSASNDRDNEIYQSPTASVPKLNEFSGWEKLFASSASNDRDSEIHQFPTASFAPKLNGFSGWEKFFASSACNDRDNEIKTPPYFKPLNIDCESYDEIPYIGKTISTLITSKPCQKNESYSVNKQIPSVQPIGYPRRKTQKLSSPIGTGRNTQNVSDQIPAGARPILRKRV